MPPRIAGLTAGDRVGPDAPVWGLLADLDARHALVVAVVPLGKVFLGLDLVVGEADNLGGLPCPLTGAGQHEAEVRRVEPAAQRFGLGDPVLGQFQVGHRGVLPGLAPLGLAVANQV